MEAAEWEPCFSTHRLENVRGVGRGAFGEVTLVRATRLDEEGGAADEDSRAAGAADGLLVLKRSNLSCFSDAAAEAALSEARLLRKLGAHHECILRCYDFRLVHGTSTVLELLLEFAHLGDLNRRISACRDAGEEKGLPQGEVVSYARDVAAALSYLHGLLPKVLHRDVKPANVVLFNRGELANDLLAPPRAKLADFGVAKALEYDGSFKGAATVIGTPHYFSPELCRGEQYDERTDAWALGCVAYEMICLHRPFHHAQSNLAILALRISEGEYDRESLLSHGTAYHESLICTVRELLEYEQDKRQRARDALRAFESILAAVQGTPADLAQTRWQPLDTSPEGAHGDPTSCAAGEQEGELTQVPSQCNAAGAGAVGGDPISMSEQTCLPDPPIAAENKADGDLTRLPSPCNAAVAARAPTSVSELGFLLEAAGSEVTRLLSPSHVVTSIGLAQLAPVMEGDAAETSRGCTLSQTVDSLLQTLHLGDDMIPGVLDNATPLPSPPESARTPGCSDGSREAAGANVQEMTPRPCEGDDSLEYGCMPVRSPRVFVMPLRFGAADADAERDLPVVLCTAPGMGGARLYSPKPQAGMGDSSVGWFLDLPPTPAHHWLEVPLPCSRTPQS